MDELQKFQDAIHAWQVQTFGSPTDPTGTLNHLRREVEEELIPDPTDYLEYVDCFMLLLGSAAKVGLDTDLLLELSWKKLEINKKREWGTPDAEGVVEHIKDHATPVEPSKN